MKRTMWTQEERDTLIQGIPCQEANLFDQEFATYIKPQEDIHPQVKPRRTRQRAKDGTIEEVYETDYDYCEPVFSDDVPERYSEELL